MDRRIPVLLSGALLLGAMLPAPAVATSGGVGLFTEGGNFIVQMADKPVVAYTGGIKGLSATAPKAGTKIDPLSARVLAYKGYLNAKHSAVLNAAGGRKLYDYAFSFNGFAAKLTADQANKLARTGGVLSVTPDEIRQADTSSTPTFLGLDAAGGLWSQLGGYATAGDGIIIGDIDSGIWPESLSFSDRTGVNGNASKDGKLAYQQIPGWHGKCTPGEAFVASMCNQKLIGAQWFDKGWGGDAGIDAKLPWEFASARDYNGHGTHTASTAAGNHGVTVTGPFAAFGAISGMAPHARIAMYKALWSTQAADTANGTTTDLVAAIDQAVADGVDVINYSISGTSTNFRDPVEISFLYATAAGIFVAESAGNSGPAASTVAHPAPWTTTVAAGTHNRSVVATVTFGDGTTDTGAGLAAAAVTAPLVNAADVAMAGASATAVRLCYSTETNGTPALDPAKAAGKIVVCDRGTNARVDKSLAVKEAGGVGMILLNPSFNSLNADFHSVPTVHLQSTYYNDVHGYAATAGATATINKATMDYNTPAPYTASFSSRGPNQASADLLKPDLMAPGQDILAAVAPPGNSGLDFNLYSGTSMSSPHVAGLAALLKDLHPTWTPMAIKSALMTTAYDVLDGAPTDPSVLFSQGAGFVKPNSAADPGLVFNSTMVDWLGFLCGTQLPASYCTSQSIPVVAPSDFNGASIAVSALAGSRTVTRTLTNVGAKGTYTVAVTGLKGIDVAVTPSTFTLNPGQSQKVQISFTENSAALNAYVGGYLTWSDGKHSVRIPALARPVALAAPAEVSASYAVTFGYNGSFTATPRGLVPAMTNTDTIATGQQKTYDVVVPAGTTYARFSLFDSTTTAGSDLDLYVYRGTTLVGSSGGGTAAEEVDLVSPAADTYHVVVDGFATASPTSAFTLFSWALGSADAGNMTVTAPSIATLGATGNVTLAFSGLTAGTKYLGSVVYGGATGMPAPTIVRVDP